MTMGKIPRRLGESQCYTRHWRDPPGAPPAWPRASLRPSISDFARIWDDDLGSHRDSGTRHVSVLDDHDHVSW